MNLTTILLLGILLLLILFFLLALISLASKNSKKCSQQEQDDYIAMVVHDIRSPLTVIRGSVDIILRENKSLTKDDVNKLLTQVKDTADELLEMVSAILDVSKIEAGKFEVSPVATDINLLVKMISDRFLPIYNQSNMKVNVNLETSLPKAFADPEKVERVITNLISNALKFTPEGGEVTISSRQVASFVRISVADTGIGIDDNMKPKLFNKFVQAGKTKKSVGISTGLGLKISKEIVELHGGKIWIEDNKPKGSIFIFTLPIAK